MVAQISQQLLKRTATQGKIATTSDPIGFGELYFNVHPNTHCLQFRSATSLTENPADKIITLSPTYVNETDPNTFITQGAFSDGVTWYKPSNKTFYVRVSSAWQALPAGEVIVATTPPSTSTTKPGLLWWNSQKGALAVLYQDPDSTQWVEVSATTSAQLTEYALLNSPQFSGTPQAPTPSPTDNSIRIPTTEWVWGSVTGIVGRLTTAVPKTTGYTTGNSWTFRTYPVDTVSTQVSAYVTFNVGGPIQATFNQAGNYQINTFISTDWAASSGPQGVATLVKVSGIAPEVLGDEKHTNKPNSTFEVRNRDSFIITATTGLTVTFEIGLLVPTGTAITATPKTGEITILKVPTIP